MKLGFSFHCCCEFTVYHLNLHVFPFCVIVNPVFKDINFNAKFIFYRKVHHESEVSMDPLKMDLMRVRPPVSIQKSHLIMPEEPAM